MLMILSFGKDTLRVSQQLHGFHLWYGQLDDFGIRHPARHLTALNPSLSYMMPCSDSEHHPKST